MIQLEKNLDFHRSFLFFAPVCLLLIKQYRSCDGFCWLIQRISRLVIEMKEEIESHKGRLALSQDVPRPALRQATRADGKPSAGASLCLPPARTAALVHASLSRLSYSCCYLYRISSHNTRLLLIMFSSRLFFLEDGANLSRGLPLIRYNAMRRRPSLPVHNNSALLL